MALAVRPPAGETNSTTATLSGSGNGCSTMTPEVPEVEDFDWARKIPEELEYGWVMEATLVFSWLQSPVPAWDPIPLHIEAIVRRIAEETAA